MGTYDTRGGSAASPEAQDESCDFCAKDPNDCECSPEVLENFHTERAFLLAMKGVPAAALARSIRLLDIHVNFTGCSKKQMAPYWADDSHHGPFRSEHTLALLRRSALAAMLPSERRNG